MDLGPMNGDIPETQKKKKEMSQTKREETWPKKNVTWTKKKSLRQIFFINNLRPIN